MLGSHRERNPSRSENWHRRTTIYILLPRRVISSSSSHPSRIPRNSAAGDWRWRPRALRDKPHQHTGAHQRQPTPTNIPRHRRSPETFGDTGEKVIGQEEGVSSVSSTEATLSRPLRAMARRVSRYECDVRRYSNNRDPGLSLQGAAKSSSS